MTDDVILVRLREYVEQLGFQVNGIGSYGVGSHQSAALITFQSAEIATLFTLKHSDIPFLMAKMYSLLYVPIISYVGDRRPLGDFAVRYINK